MPALIKRVLSRAANSPVLTGFVSLLERLDRRGDNLLQVLTYHRINDPWAHPDLAPSTISATPAIFEMQMTHLAAHYRVVTLAEVYAACYEGAPLPGRAVLITFDDAYQDFAEHAWPILKRNGLPATLFVPTAYPDHPERAFWWDRLHATIGAARGTDTLPVPWVSLALESAQDRKRAYRELVVWLKSLPDAEARRWLDQLADELNEPPARSHVLGWEALRRLAAEGVALGAHTQTHALMYRVTPEAARAEAVGSLADLRRQIGDVLPAFAYPGGKFNAAAVEALRAAGFCLAFASRRGINRLDTADPLRLRRNHIGFGTSQAVFRARLLSWSLLLNRWRPVTGS